MIECQIKVFFEPAPKKGTILHQKWASYGGFWSAQNWHWFAHISGHVWLGNAKVWETIDFMQVQTKQLFEKKLELILEFYDHFHHFHPITAPYVTYIV